MKIFCTRCAQHVEPITKVQLFEGSEHLRADCPLCGRWIKWLPKGSAEIDIKFERPTLESIKKLHENTI